MARAVKRNDERVLLPRDVVPLKYILCLTVDIDRHIFTGDETIETEVSRHTTSISLHIRELLIQSVSYITAQGTTIDVVSMLHDLKLSTLTLTFSQELPLGKGGKLHILYQGSHNNQMQGFYRSSYHDIHGRQRTMVSTHFEPLAARRCFPCWDEPAVKAVFELSLVVPAHLMGLSNMPEVESVQRPDGKKVIRFAPTPKMSTYLVAFVVGEFDLVQDQTKNGARVRVYTPPGRAKDGLFALHAARNALDLYDEFFATPYPLPKVDMVAIPEFPIGGEMRGASSGLISLVVFPYGLELGEGYQRSRDESVVNEGRCPSPCLMRGLPGDVWQVTYREPTRPGSRDRWLVLVAHARNTTDLIPDHQAYLMIDEDKASSQQKQRVAVIVAHELSHMWFGNLVTMQWWDDLWLKEGFASWTENFATDHQFPSWEMWTQFTGNTQARALHLDSLRSSHPIQVPIKHAEEAEQVFDAISYCKGASVIRMIYAVLGKDDFRKGLQLYFSRHQYSNTETYDLWDAWETVSGKPVGQIMASWTEQMGFPLIRVTRADLEAPDGVAVLEVEQSWFLADGSSGKGNGDAKLWTVPLLYGTNTSAATPHLDLMTGRTHQLKVHVKPGQWIMLNLGQHAPLRVSYPPAMLARLAEGVKDKSLPATDRAGLLLGSYDLVKTGDINPSDLLTLVKAYSNEDNSTVWDALAQVLAGLDKLLAQGDPVLHAKFAAFAASMVKPAASRVGWDPRESDGHLGKLLRATLISLLNTFCWRDEEVVSEARRRFDRIMEDPSDVATLPSEYKIPVLAMVLKNGGQQEFNQVMKMCADAPTNIEKRQVYMAIGATSPLDLKRRVLDWALAEVKLQDFFFPMGSVSSSNREGMRLAWDFFRDNFQAIRSKLATANPSLMDAVIINCCGNLGSENGAQEIEDFFQAHPLPSSQRKIAQTLENSRIMAKLSRRLEADLNREELWRRLAAA